MRNRSPFLHLSFIILLVVFLSLACKSAGGIPMESTYKYPEPVYIWQTTDFFTFAGTGTTTWSWNKGEMICVTQDEMTLTIDGYKDVVLSSVGICESPNVNGVGCYELHPGDKCGNTIKGKFDEKTDQITFSTCNAGEASGSAVWAFNRGHFSNEVTGEVTCPAYQPDPYVLKFTLTLK
jgi:hypothetical protein